MASCLSTPYPSYVINGLITSANMHAIEPFIGFMKFLVAAEKSTKISSKFEPLRFIGPWLCYHENAHNASKSKQASARKKCCKHVFYQFKYSNNYLVAFWILDIVERGKNYNEM
jgi:hypothetical protein